MLVTAVSKLFAAVPTSRSADLTAANVEAVGFALAAATFADKVFSALDICPVCAEYWDFTSLFKVANCCLIVAMSLEILARAPWLSDVSLRLCTVFFRLAMSEHTAGLLLALLLGLGPLPVVVVLLQLVRATARTPTARSRRYREDAVTPSTVRRDRGEAHPPDRMRRAAGPPPPSALTTIVHRG